MARRLAVVAFTLSCSFHQDSYPVLGDLSGMPGQKDSGPGPTDGSSDLACMPQKVACGHCGTKMGTCTDGGLVFGACGGEGACAPGDSYATSDGCMIRYCSMACQWGAWQPKPGAECVSGGSKTCVTGGCGSGLQRCVNCRWGPCTC